MRSWQPASGLIHPPSGASGGALTYRAEATQRLPCGQGVASAQRPSTQRSMPSVVQRGVALSPHAHGSGGEASRSGSARSSHAIACNTAKAQRTYRAFMEASDHRRWSPCGPRGEHCECGTMAVRRWRVQATGRGGLFWVQVASAGARGRRRRRRSATGASALPELYAVTGREHEALREKPVLVVGEFGQNTQGAGRRLRVRISGQQVLPSGGAQE